MTADTIVFDLDGTLIDSAPDLYGTVRWLLRHEGRADVSYDRVKDLIGDGAAPMIRGSFADTGEAPEGADFHRLLDLFLAHYGAHLADHSEAFPGAVSAVLRCKARGSKVAVCTNKRFDFADRLLNLLGISQHFDAITGSDTFAFRKPDGRHLLETVRMAGGDAERVIMVGDSATDVGAARNAGVPVIAVTFGYGHGSAHDLGADAVIDHFDQLDAAIARLQASRT